MMLLDESTESAVRNRHSCGTGGGIAAALVVHTPLRAGDRRQPALWRHREELADARDLRIRRHYGGGSRDRAADADPAAGLPDIPRRVLSPLRYRALRRGDVCAGNR